MQSYSATQNTIATASSKIFCWLLTVITTTSVTHRWSLITKTYDAQDYTTKIIAGTFSGINLHASESEHGIQAPNTLSFQIMNAGNVLIASDFLDASVTVSLVVDDGVTGDHVMGTWKFNVKRCNPEQQKLKFECEDFIQKHLKGDWPNTTLVKDAFLSNDSVDESLCIPVPIGNLFIPLESILSGGSRYYLLGPANKTYGISKVRSPRRTGYKHDWSSPAFTFTQSNQTGLDGISYRVFTALIAEGGAHGLFQDGDSFLPLPTKFTRDDTSQINGSETGTHNGAGNAAILTDTGATWGVNKLIDAYVINVTDGSYGKITDNNATTVTATLAGGTDNDWDIGDSYAIGGPASIIRWVLIDFGISSSDIDDMTFAIAEKAFAGWNLVWNGVFTKKQSRKSILSFLLNQCNAYLVIREKICLFIYSKTSQKTLTKADIIKPRDVGPDSFRTTRLERIDQDSGFIEWQPADEIQNEWQKVKVSAKFSSGVHDGAGNAAILTDTGQNWPANSLVGGIAKNTTDGSSATITANAETTVTGTLTGGTDNDWDIDDIYEIEVCNNISNEALPVHFIQDSQDAQKAGILHFERKFLAKSQVVFNSKATCLMLEPGDVIDYNCFAFDEHLVGYWAFDDGSGTVAVDGSGNSNNGTLVNSPTWVDGVVGKCLSFEADNNEYVSIDDSLLVLNDDFTLSFWVRPEDDATNSRWVMIDAADNFQVGQMANETIFIRMDATSIETAASIFSYGTWYHVVVIRSGGTFTLYIDSALTSMSAGGPCFNGQFPNCDGKMDEVRLYSTALTASEIKELYHNPGGNRTDFKVLTKSVQIKEDIAMAFTGKTYDI